jgi:tetratricopeptide (TPR) repeat protein
MYVDLLRNVRPKLTAVQYKMTKYVWAKRVELSYLVPNFGICINVLNTAARHGDVHLATDVFRVLTERSAVFNEQDYELLLEAYLNAGDLKIALSVLPVMHTARKKIDRNSTRILFKYLRESPERPKEAFFLLLDLQKSGQVIPTNALNCVIEASIDVGELSQAIEQYRALHQICRGGPNTDTFDVLIKGCIQFRRKDLAMFLASEMVALKIQPTDHTYSRLIRVCLLDREDHEDAVRYFEEMTARNMVPKVNAFGELVDRMVAAEDMRVVSVVESMADMGLFVPRDVWERFLVLAPELRFSAKPDLQQQQRRRLRDHAKRILIDKSDHHDSTILSEATNMA